MLHCCQSPVLKIVDKKPLANNLTTQAYVTKVCNEFDVDTTTAATIVCTKQMPFSLNFNFYEKRVTFDRSPLIHMEKNPLLLKVYNTRLIQAT